MVWETLPIAEISLERRTVKRKKRRLGAEISTSAHVSIASVSVGSSGTHGTPRNDVGDFGVRYISGAPRLITRDHELKISCAKDARMNRLEELVESTKNVVPTSQEKEEQRRSFAYGNTKIENPRITRETVDAEAESLKSSNK